LGYIPSELLALVEELNEGVGCFTLLHGEWSSLCIVKQIRDVVMRTCDLFAILNPRVETCNCHLAGPLMTNDQS
jgi:hypothetical protein